MQYELRQSHPLQQLAQTKLLHPHLPRMRLMRRLREAVHYVH